MALNIHEFPPLLQLLEFVNNKQGTSHNSLYIIYYRECLQFINRHQDKTPTFVDGSSFLLINLLVKGLPRVFQITKKNKDIVAALAMVNNEAVQLSAKANDEFYHELIPCPTDQTGIRVSLTFRSINNTLLVRPAEERSVKYSNGLTPLDHQMKSISIEVCKNDV